MRKGHPWDDLIFRALRHAWLFDAYHRHVSIYLYTLGCLTKSHFQKQKTQEFTKNNELLCFYIRAKNLVFSQTLLFDVIKI